MQKITAQLRKMFSTTRTFCKRMHMVYNILFKTHSEMEIADKALDAAFELNDKLNGTMSTDQEYWFAEGYKTLFYSLTKK